ncbi:MAG TPA: prohibitin family protein [Pantanalinema sp.]
MKELLSSKPSLTKPVLAGAGLLLFTALLASFGLGACTTIEPGAVGVKTNVYTGGIASKPLSAGIHFVGFGSAVYEFPTVVDNINLDNLSVNTKEGQSISIDLRVQYKPNFSIDNDNVVRLYQRYKKPFNGANGLVNTRWEPVIQQAAGYAFSQYGIIEVYQSRGARVASLMKQVLQNGLKNDVIDIDGIGDDFVSIETVAVSDIGLPEAIKRSVEMKAQIEQETLAAKQNLEKSRMEAERQRIEAQGKADASLIEAQGRAKARAALGISPEQYTKIEITKLQTEAIQKAPNLVIVPDKALLNLGDLVQQHKAAN